MTTATQRTSFNAASFGRFSHITDGHKAVFWALTSGEPNFCLTSVYINGEPGVAIVLANREGDTVEIMPCFASITPGTRLRFPDGVEYPSNNNNKKESPL